ncbi:MAG: hypothetical protein ITG00_01225 [Flavobacterium sp.]|nr:hypothetical protein [Flavobacterium sp.]
MRDIILQHQQPEEIHKKFMQNDLKRWKDEIEIINVEMIFYRNLINAHLKEVTTWNTADYKNLFSGIADVQNSNKRFQKSFLEFSNKLEGINECDDLQCETYFLNDHADFKAEIEKHFTNYKNFKKTIFSYLRTKYNY